MDDNDDSQYSKLQQAFAKNLENLNQEDIFEAVINYQQRNGNCKLYYKLTKNYLIDVLDSDKLHKLEIKFKDFPRKGVDVVEFLKIFITTIEVPEEEIFYLVLAIIQLFKEISESLSMSPVITFQDLTDFVCESFVYKDVTTYPLPTVKMPEKKKFEVDINRIRDIDVNPPLVFGKNEYGIRRLLPNTLITDSENHNNRSIQCGVYAQEIQRVITLNSLTSRLNVYNLNCKLEQRIVPSTLTDRDIVILGFAYSNRQQRVGAVFKDYSIYFWDWSDNFNFQKSFSTSQFLPDYQTNIWWLDQHQLWVTTDKSNSISSWNIEGECIDKHIQSKSIKGNINEIVEIIHIKLVALATTDKKIQLLNLKKETFILNIELSSAGIHHLLYSYNYQCLISVGYENEISVFGINPFYYDFHQIGKLAGHNSMITAIQQIENTPMLISTDDQGYLKVWDLRNFKCIQSINMGTRTIINKILDINDKKQICLLGARVNFIKFDLIKDDHQDEVYPVKVEYNQSTQQLIVCSRKDLRFFDLETGRIKKIFNGLLQNSEDEIANFRSVNQFKAFILCDHRGKISMHSHQIGEFIKPLHGHQHEVSQLYIDFTNKLFISSSWDSTVLIQKETKLGSEIKRTIKNAHYVKDITNMEVTLYHNLIITTSNSNDIYFWDYEFVKLVGAISINGTNIEPTSVTVINGISLLLICTNDAEIFIVKFEYKEMRLTFEVIGYIDLLTQEQRESLYKQIIVNTNNQQQQQQYINEDDQEMQQNGQNSSPYSPYPVQQTSNSNSPGQQQSENATQINSLFNRYSDNNQIQKNNSGTNIKNVSQFNVNSQNENIKTKYTTEQTGQINQIQFNPNTDKNEASGTRQTKQSIAAIKKENKKLSMIFVPQKQSQKMIIQKSMPSNYANKMLADIQYDKSAQTITHCKIYVTMVKGNIIGYDLLEFIKSKNMEQISEPANKKTNYNPFRSNNEDFLSVGQKIDNQKFIIEAPSYNITDSQLQRLEKYKCVEFQAHKDTITCFNFIDLKERFLVTGSIDSFIRIWKTNGELQGNAKLTHPLPIFWQVEQDEKSEQKKQLYYSLKILELTMDKYKQDQFIRKILKISTFINKIVKDNLKIKLEQQQQQSLQMQQQQEKLLLLQQVEGGSDQQSQEQIQQQININKVIQKKQANLELASDSQSRDKSNSKDRDQLIIEISSSKFKTQQQLQQQMSQNQNSNQAVMNSTQASLKSIQEKKGQKIKEQDEEDIEDQGQKSSSKNVQIITMAQEYSPRDLQFAKCKVLFEKELKGASLREMEANKNLSMAQQHWKASSEADHNINEIGNLKIKQREEQEIKNSLTFLTEGWKQKLTKRSDQNQELVETIYYLGKKMDLYVSEINKGKKPVISNILGLKPKKGQNNTTETSEEDLSPHTFAKHLKELENDQVSPLRKNRRGSLLVYLEQQEKRSKKETQKKNEKKFDANEANKLQQQTRSMFKSQSQDFFAYAQDKKIIEINSSQIQSLQRQQQQLQLNEISKNKSQSLSLFQSEIQHSIASHSIKQLIEKNKMHNAIKNLDNNLRLAKLSVVQNAIAKAHQVDNSFSKLLSENESTISKTKILEKDLSNLKISDRLQKLSPPKLHLPQLKQRIQNFKDEHKRQLYRSMQTSRNSPNQKGTEICLSHRNSLDKY